MKDLRVLIIFLLLPAFLLAQDKLGIANSNYHPVSSIHLNASSSVDSRTFMQLNLVGANVFVTSNAAYLPNFSYPGLIATRSLPSPVPSGTKRNNFIYGNIVADGPSLMVSKDKYGAGLFVRARSVVDIRRMPYELTDFLFNPDNIEVQQSGTFNMNNPRISNMTWAEYGANFGMMILRKQNNLITVGGNIKYLTGINLLFVNIASLNADYGPGEMNVAQLEGKMRTAAPAWKSGRGFGVDLGLTYKKTLKHIDGYKSHSRSSHCTAIDYKYKIGLSLRDLGCLAFRGNTNAADFKGSADLAQIDAGTDYQSLLQNNFNAVFTQGQKLRASLPTAVSGQFDYNFENNIYLNFTLNKNVIPNGVTGVQSSDLISIAPRFETKILEVAMPFTLQRFMYPQLGFAFRVRSFVLGFDNAMPWVLKRNTSTVGVYFNLAISLFKNPGCGSGLRKIDDCIKYKTKKQKIKRKNSLISPRPRKK